MAEIYHPSTGKRSTLLSWGMGAFFTFLIFLMVPITQFIADATKPRNDYDVMQSVLPPPADFDFEEEEPEEEEEEEEPPEMEEEPPQLTLEQLELSLNVGTGGDLKGDFALPGFSASDSDLDLDGLFEMKDLDDKPSPTKRVVPKYPKALAKRKVTGMAKLQFVIDQYGNVTDVQVLEASHPEFGDAAATAIGQWKFEPGKKDGQAVKTKAQLRIPFNIK